MSLILIATLGISLVSSQGSSTFYVCNCLEGASGSCVAGDDNNPGTVDQPWKTVDYALDQFNSLSAGQSIAFCKGGSFAIQQYTKISNQNCQASNHCTLTAYDTESSQKPIITSNDKYGLFFGDSGENDGGYTVKDLNIRAGIGKEEGVFIANSINNIIIDSVVIQGFKNGIFASVWGTSVVSDITLKNSIIKDNEQRGWYASCSNCIIENNYFENNGHGKDSSPNYQQIRWAGDKTTTNGVIRDNEFYKTSQKDGKCQGEAIFISGNHHDLLIENNDIHEDSSTDSCYGIRIQGFSSAVESFDNPTIARNRLENMGKRAITCHACRNGVIENNVIVHQQELVSDAIDVPGRSKGADAQTEGMKIRNNVIYVNSNQKGNGIRAGWSDLASSGFEIVSNIVYYMGSNSDYNCFDFAQQSSSYSAIDNNLCYTPNAPGAEWEHNSGNLQAWQTASGFDSNSLQDNPLFVSAPSNVQLAVNSPAIDAGHATKSASRDFDNTHRDSSPDIGAFESSEGGQGQCANGQTQECGSGVGACQKGLQTCTNSQWGHCQGQIDPILEICLDSIDNNCDGQVDELCAVCGNNVIETGEVCDTTNLNSATCATNGFDSGNLSCRSDCTGFNVSACVTNDVNETQNQTREKSWDLDNDGFNATQKGGRDCNDQDPSINPDADSVCDGIDNNCDGIIDQGCSCADGQTQRCGSDVGRCQAGVQVCQSNQWGVCLDQVGAIQEICDNAVDDDCNGLIDENCERCGNGIVEAEEVCDQDNIAEQTCNLQGFTAGTLLCRADCTGFDTSYCQIRDVDIDNDGYASIEFGGFDCNDNNPQINPGAQEICGNNLDENCNEQLNDGCGGICDTDQDGHDEYFWCLFGGPNDDCNDDNALINPSSPEVCDNIDNNCNVFVDEGGVCEGFVPTSATITSPQQQEYNFFPALRIEARGTERCEYQHNNGPWQKCTNMPTFGKKGANTINARVTDSTGAFVTTSVSFTITSSPRVMLQGTDFDRQRTTPLDTFSEEQLQQIQSLTFDNDHGQIKFTEDVSIERDLIIEDHIEIEDKRVEVNSSYLSELDKSAEILMKNVEFNNPVIYKDGTECPSGECRILSYEDGELLFRVEGFTEYTIIDASPTTPITVELGTTRLSGVAPLAILFDATNTTDADFEREFHTLLYEWDFDDSTAGTWHNSGKSKNRAIGAVAGHLFTQPGTYNVRLTVTNPNGDYVTAQVTPITVYDPNDPVNGIGLANTWCFANSGTPGGSGFEGCPHNDASRHQVTSDYSSAVLTVCNADAASRQCLFRRGDSFTSTSLVNLHNAPGPGLIGAFGSGSRPVINGRGPNTAGSDWRIMDLVFQSNGIFGVNDLGGTNGVIDYTLYNVDTLDYQKCWNAFLASTATQFNRVAFIDYFCKIHPTASTHWVGFGQLSHSLLMGVTIQNGGADLPSGEIGPEGIIRTTHLDHSVMQHMNLTMTDSPGCVNCKNSISLRACEAGNGACIPGQGNNPDEYNIISDNYIEEKISGVIRLCTDSGCHNGDPGNPNQNVIIERNFIKILPNANERRVGSIIRSQAGDLTVRNNVVDHGGLIDDGRNVFWFIQEGAGSDSSNRNNNHIYHNAMHSTENSRGGQFRICQYALGSGHVCRSNLMYMPNNPNKIHVQGSGADTNNAIDGQDYSGYPFDTAYPGIDSSQMDDFQLNPSFTSLVDSGFDFSSLSTEHIHMDAGESTRPQGPGYDIGAFEIGGQACTNGQARSCGSDVGECVAGTETCVSGSWGSCVGSIGPTTEVCDSLDNNCDGQIDESCNCIDGQTQSCGSNVGECQQGTQTCVNGDWETCTGAINPTTEICDSLDNNCNGQTDEGGVCTSTMEVQNVQSAASYVNGNSISLSYTAPVDGILLVRAGAMGGNGPVAQSITFNGQAMNNVASLSRTDYWWDISADMYWLPVTAGQTGSVDITYPGGTWATSRRGMIAMTLSGVDTVDSHIVTTQGLPGNTNRAGVYILAQDQLSVSENAIVVSALTTNGWGASRILDHTLDAFPTVPMLESDGVSGFHSSRFYGGHTIVNPAGSQSYSLGYRLNDDTQPGGDPQWNNGWFDYILILAAFTNGASTVSCGNNVREGSEVCDGIDLNSQSCLTQGFDQGTLSCDRNCLSFDTTLCVETDVDNDGYVSASHGGQDCNDNNPSINPGATEVCGNLVDEDCDAVLDNNCQGVCDTDGDGHEEFAWCIINPAPNDDCDDNDREVFPGNQEVCDGKDNNCDTIIDGNVRTCGLDVGQCQSGTEICNAGSWGQCTGNIGPTTETCDDIDNNCDGQVDEGLLCIQPQETALNFLVHPQNATVYSVNFPQLRFNRTALGQQSAQPFRYCSFTINDQRRHPCHNHPTIGKPGENHLIISVINRTGHLLRQNTTFTVTAPISITFNESRFNTSQSTNFSQLDQNDFSDISQPEIVNSHGKIQFDQLELQRSLFINDEISISNNRIFVNSSLFYELNRSATLTLTNLTIDNPRILKDGAACDASVCSIQSYRGGNLTFTVGHFTTYESEETPPTCSDGIQNGDESGVDCGGSCASCTSSSPPPSAGSSGGGGGGGGSGGGAIPIRRPSSDGEEIQPSQQSSDQEDQGSIQEDIEEENQQDIQDRRDEPLPQESPVSQAVEMVDQTTKSYPWVWILIAVSIFVCLLLGAIVLERKQKLPIPHFSSHHLEESRKPGSSIPVIQKYLNRTGGVSEKEEIKRNLLNHGWNKETIDEQIKIYEKEHKNEDF